MANRFDLEQQIMDCWHVVDDLKVLFENVVEDENLTKDTISNVVLGLEELYQMKFDKLFRTFEQVTKDEWSCTKANWDVIAETNLEREAEIQQARDYLAKYLNEFPEHDQGDIRVFAAYELLSGNEVGYNRLFDEQKHFNEVFDKIDKMIAEPQQTDWVTEYIEKEREERPF